MSRNPTPPTPLEIFTPLFQGKPPPPFNPEIFQPPPPPFRKGEGAHYANGLIIWFENQKRSLTLFTPMSHFYTPRKWEMEMGHWREKGSLSLFELFQISIGK